MQHKTHLGIVALAAMSVFFDLAASAQTSLVVNRILTVDASGTPEENCVALQTALGEITDSSLVKPYHVRLEPGVYSCGPMASSILVPPYVVVEGAGVDATTIEGSRNGFSAGGVFRLKDGAELRYLTVQNTGGGSTTFAVVFANQDDLDTFARLTHVRAIAGPGSNFSAATYIVRLPDSLTVRPVLFIHDSYLQGAKDALVSDGAEFRGDYRINNSQLVATDGSDLTRGFGCNIVDTCKCVNAYDINLDPLAATCEAPAG